MSEMPPAALPLHRIVNDFAGAFKAVDQMKPQGRSRTRVYQPGIGPLAEAEAIRLAVDYLKERGDAIYLDAGPAPYPGSRQLCDLVIPGHWAIEFKLIRPYGDNGREAEHWSENILHPYPGNTSALGDCLKLLESRFVERKAVIVLGYEHTPPQLPLEPAVRAFEAIATQVLSLPLGDRQSAKFIDLVHPHHQQGTVYAWPLISS